VSHLLYCMINNLRFADDIAVATENEYHLQLVINGTEKEYSRMRMHILVLTK